MTKHLSKKIIGTVSLLIMSMLIPSYSFADQGFTATVEHGEYRFQFTCHYEPSPYCILNSVSNRDSTEPDTLSLPPFVVMYNDTFPVTEIDKIGRAHV